MLLQAATLLTLLVASPPAATAPGTPAERDISPTPELMAQARTLADAPAFAVPSKEIARWPANTDPFQMLLTEVHLRYDDAGRLVRTSRMVYRLNHPSSIDHFGTREFDWAAWHQNRPQIDIRVVSPSGEERRLDPTTISERVGRVQNQVIDDRRTLVAALPGLTVGALVEEVLVTTDSRPVYPGAPVSGGHRFFASEVSSPIQRLVIDSARPPQLATANWPHAPPKVEKKGDRHIVAIEVKRAGQERDPARIEWSLGGTWQDAANAYATLIAEPARGPAPAELTKKGLGPAETMKLVAQKMRYTGLSLGDASVVPYPAPEVWKRGYGDCKDVSLLVVNALEAQGIKASLALLQAGEDDDILPEVAGLDRFNHAIVYVHPDGTRPALWLDTTAPDLPAGTLPASALERWALLVHPTLGAKLIQTPSRESQPDTVTIDTLIEARPMAEARVRESITWTGTMATATASTHKTGEPPAKRLLWVGNRFKAKELLSAETRPDGDRFLATATFDAPTLSLGFEEGHFPIDHYAHLFEFLPESDGEALRQPRRLKLVHTTRIVPPAGFVIATEGLGDAEVPLGPATWRETFTRDGDALVARAELDLGKLDWDKADAAAFQKALGPFQDTKVPMVHVVAKSRLEADRGDLVTAFATLRDALKARPKDGDTRARLALLLAESGLLELAKLESQRALADQPESRLAGYGDLFVSITNPLGDSLGAGYDRAVALASARKMHKRHPSDFASRMTLAQVLMQGEDGAPRLGPEHGEGLELMKALALEGHQVAVGAWATGAAREARWQELKEIVPKLEGLELANSLMAAAIAGTDGPEALRRALPSMARTRSQQTELVGAAIGFLALARDYAGATRVGEAFLRDHQNLAPQIKLLSGIKRLEYRNDYSAPEAALGSLITAALDETRDSDSTLGELFSTFGSESVAMSMDLIWGMSRRIIDGDDAGGWRVRLVVEAGASPFDLPTWWRHDGKKLVLVSERAGARLGIEAMRRLTAGDVAGAKRWFGWWLEHAAASGQTAWTLRWPDPQSVSNADLELGIAALAATDGEHAPALKVIDKRFAELPPELRRELLNELAEARGVKTAAGLRALWTEALGGRQPEPPDWLALLAALGKYEHAADALKVLDERVKESPADPGWPQLRAFTLMHARRYDEAAAQLAELRRAGRISSTSMNNAAWIDLMRGQVTAESAELARKATAQQGHAGRAAQHTLALVELDRGRIAEALEARKKSVKTPRKLEPHDELVRARIADRLGFSDWAKTTYEKLLRAEDPEVKALSKRYLDALPKR